MNAGKLTQEDGAKHYRQPKLEARIKEKENIKQITRQTKNHQ